MTLSRIHHCKPSITELEVKYATDAAANGWGAQCYDYIFKFRDLLKNYLNVPYVLPTSSCTGAIHLALAALEIGEGDEVILPDLTWVASAAPISYMGAKPVLVDVLKETWCIDPKAIKAAITEKTKAIIVVHLYGNLCEMDEIMAIAAEHNIPVIEDAAEALGSEYKGKKAGSIGDMATFSFHGSKLVTTGEGGALIVQSPELYEKIVILDGHGRDPKISKQYWASRIGYKYKMSNLEASLGTAQLERIDELVARKREIFSEYKKRLGNIEEIQLNAEQDKTVNSYWMTTVIFDESVELDRDEILQDMVNANIDARSMFYPLSLMPPFEENLENEVSYSLHSRGINIPCYHDITVDDIERVCGVILAYLEKK